MVTCEEERCRSMVFTALSRSNNGNNNIVTLCGSRRPSECFRNHGNSSVVAVDEFLNI